MLKTISLGAEFLGNGLAVLALLRLVVYKVTGNETRQWLFPALLLTMAFFCATNVGYAITVTLPDNSYVGWGSGFEAAAETIQILAFLYITPVLLTLIVATNVLQKRGFKLMTRKVGM